MSDAPLVPRLREGAFKAVLAHMAAAVAGGQRAEARALLAVPDEEHEVQLVFRLEDEDAGERLMMRNAMQQAPEPAEPEPAEPEPVEPGPRGQPAEPAEPAEPPEPVEPGPQGQPVEPLRALVRFLCFSDDLEPPAECKRCRALRLSLEGRMGVCADEEGEDDDLTLELPPVLGDLSGWAAGTLWSAPQEGALLPDKPPPVQLLWHVARRAEALHFCRACEDEVAADGSALCFGCRARAPEPGEDAAQERQAHECAICHETLVRGEPLDCGHRFHRRCVRRWFAQNPQDPTCPMCRRPAA
jgi:hypothetical protein